MAVICPCCGQAVTGDVEIAGIRAIPMTMMQRRITDALIKAYPRYIDAQGVADALYWDDYDGGPDVLRKAVDNHLRRLRAALRPVGWTVTGGRGSGRIGRYALQRLPK